MMVHSHISENQSTATLRSLANYRRIQWHTVPGYGIVHRACAFAYRVLGSDCENSMFSTEEDDQLRVG